jgi:hypothetical protein
LPWAPCTSACSLLAGMHIKQLKGNFRHNTENEEAKAVYIAHNNIYRSLSTL